MVIFLLFLFCINTLHTATSTLWEKTISGQQLAIKEYEEKHRTNRVVDDWLSKPSVQKEQVIDIRNPNNIFVESCGGYGIVDEKNIELYNGVSESISEFKEGITLYTNAAYDCVIVGVVSKDSHQKVKKRSLFNVTYAEGGYNSTREIKIIDKLVEVVSNNDDDMNIVIASGTWSSYVFDIYQRINKIEKLQYITHVNIFPIILLVLSHKFRFFSIIPNSDVKLDLQEKNYLDYLPLKKQGEWYRSAGLAIDSEGNFFIPEVPEITGKSVQEKEPEEIVKQEKHYLEVEKKIKEGIQRESAALEEIQQRVKKEEIEQQKRKIILRNIGIVSVFSTFILYFLKKKGLFSLPRLSIFK